MDLESLIVKRIDELGVNIRSLADVYMKWYTFYWTLNSAALAWLWAAGSGGPPRVVYWFFAVMAIPASISSFVVKDALVRMCNELNTLNRELVARHKDGGNATVLSILERGAWPTDVTRWGIAVNGAATFFLGVVWAYLALR
ncbi:MAG: hypothetical protein U0638_12650 [Phycisphaerales bacterium]